MTHNDEMRHLRRGLREKVDTLAAYKDALRSATGEVAARLTQEITKLQESVAFMRGQFSQRPISARRRSDYRRP